MDRRQRRRRLPPSPSQAPILLLFSALIIASQTIFSSAFAPIKNRCAKNNRRRESSSVNIRCSSIICSAKGEANNSNEDVNNKKETNNGNGNEDEAPNQTTISGGTPLIFEMARRMLVWDDELYESDAGGGAMPPSPPSLLSLPPEKLSTLSSASSNLPVTSLPRWRPNDIITISNANPSFRTAPPVMSNAGYASILRRNSRKKNKPSMWKHTLRVYSKMEELEKENPNISGKSKVVAKGNQIPGVGYTSSLSSPTSNLYSSGARKKKKRIKRSTTHHEAALVAASKLGGTHWEEAISIFRGVESSVSNATSSAVEYSNGTVRKVTNRVTDNMILSVVISCVKGSKVKRTTLILGSSDGINSYSNSTANSPPPQIMPSRPMLRALSIEERRRPLDVARDIVLSMEKKHDIPLVAKHINPLAAAYNRLGLQSEASKLINEHLQDRSPPPPPPKPERRKNNHYWKAKRELVSDNQFQDPGFEAVKSIDFSDDDLDDDDSDGYEEMQLNIHQMKSKDRASYSLLVQGAAMEGDWTGAVKELQRMTDAGLHPNTRNLNSWNEVMERGCRPTSGDYDANTFSRRRGLKKKRDRIWFSNL